MSPWNEATHARFAKIQNEESRRAYQTAVLLAVALFPAAAVLDLFTQPDHLFELSVIRYSSTLFYVILYLLSRASIFPFRNIFASGVFLLTSASFSISCMCIVLDGYLSPYYAGVNLVMVASSVLFPWNARQMLIAVSCIFGTYFLAMLIDAGFQIQGSGVLINNLYFLFATSVISVASAAVADRRRRAAFTQLVQLEETSTQKQLRDDFISIASHELKTPLTALKLQAQYARRKTDAPGADEQDMRLARMVDEQVDRLSKLVEDMLDVTRINQGALVLQLDPTDLSSLVQDVVGRLSAQLRSSNIKLDISLQPGLLGHWDPRRLEQVMINLITNAMKYGEGKPVRIRTWSASGVAYLEVTDQGMGISAENQARIFHRFERAVTNQKVGGLGLGLYITSEIVHAHKGEITVESALGQGARFTVKLPIRPSSSSTLNISH